MKSLPLTLPNFSFAISPQVPAAPLYVLSVNSQASKEIFDLSTLEKCFLWPSLISSVPADIFNLVLLLLDSVVFVEVESIVDSLLGSSLESSGSSSIFLFLLVVSVSESEESEDEDESEDESEDELEDELESLELELELEDDESESLSESELELELEEESESEEP